MGLELGRGQRRLGCREHALVVKARRAHAIRRNDRAYDGDETLTDGTERFIDRHIDPERAGGGTIRARGRGRLLAWEFVIMRATVHVANA
jgi:hypothetical protein